MQLISGVTVTQIDGTKALAAADRGEGNGIAVMLTGGGALAAYQVGLLRGIARHFPHLYFDIITGVSAGAINATFLAARPGDLVQKAAELTDLWLGLECNSIYTFDWRMMIPFRSALASIFWRKKWSRPHGLVHTTPLRELLCRTLDVEPDRPISGVIENLREGKLKSFALMTLDYSTGQNVRWIQGRQFEIFEDKSRRSTATQMTVDHVLASAALPFIFPAIRIGDEWHGDGGIRLAAPLSPAVRLGATRIIVMATGYQKTADEANTRQVAGYPPAAQVLGQLMDAVFLDAIDEDVARMERVNELLRKIDPHERNGFKPIDLLVLRPSIDLAKLSAQYEKYLPRNVKFLTRALGAKETESADFVSMLMFEPHFSQRLIELGEADIEMRVDELRTFLSEPLSEAVAL